ncbi:hypothetical protein [Xanthobacter autotrophicus]|uniref:hypothetical protein n=1 Tax=Xanthobacter autotrophicus TaxID=280 RepID=UPI0024A6BA3C|nr:hypothetical protein [Xanthobacter autotrophicus]MDI4655933.1 hypothetical protein [Xanthobacter autotrophicus]
MTRSAVDLRLVTLCALVLIPLAAAPALAQGAPQGTPQGTPQAAPSAETSAPRFAFAPVEGGALKLDRETGLVSLCAKRRSGFTCEAVPDTRDAYEAEIARLKAEVDTLRRAAGMQPQPGRPVPPPGAAPDATDLDQAFAYAERFYRRLKGLIDELRAPTGEERL